MYCSNLQLAVFLSLQQLRSLLKTYVRSLSSSGCLGTASNTFRRTYRTDAKKNYFPEHNRLHRGRSRDPAPPSSSTLQLSPVARFTQDDAVRPSSDLARSRTHLTALRLTPGVRTYLGGAHAANRDGTTAKTTLHHGRQVSDQRWSCVSADNDSWPLMPGLNSRRAQLPV